MTYKNLASLAVVSVGAVLIASPAQRGLAGRRFWFHRCFVCRSSAQA